MATKAKKTYDEYEEENRRAVIDINDYGDDVESQKQYVRDVARANGDPFMDEVTRRMVTADNPVIANNVAPATTGASKKYSDDVYGLVAEILNSDNQEPYDYTADPEYERLLEVLQLGTDDTIGRIASRTGGLASSYATTAAQQQYNSGLNEGIAALKSDAEAKRQQELSNKYSMLNMLMGIEDAEYGREQDAMNRDMAMLERQDTLNRQSRDDAYQSAMNIIMTGNIPTNEILSAAGISGEEAKYLAEYYRAENAPKYSGGGGGGENEEPEMTLSALYGMGLNADDAYFWLVSNGYTDAEADRIAADYEGWLSDTNNTHSYFYNVTGHYRYSNPGVLFTDAEYKDFETSLFNHQYTDDGFIQQIQDAHTEGKITDTQAKRLLDRYGLEY